MNRIRLILTKDFRRRLRAPAGILILMAVPLIMTAVFGAIFAPSAKGESLTIRVLVVDKDHNFGSRMLMQAFQQDRFARLFRISMVEESEGRKAIARGKASALLVIPKEFTSSLFLRRPVQLEVVKNPAETFLPRIVEEFTRTVTVLVSAAQAVFGDELAVLQPLWNREFEKIKTERLTSLLDSLRPKVARLRRFLAPPLVGLETVTEGKPGRGEDSGAAVNPGAVFGQILPGMAILFMMFIVELFMREILAEKEDGTLQRLLFSPLPPLEYVAGKIISAWFMGLMVLALLAAMGALMFGILWGNLFHLALFGGATLVGLCGFFALINAFFRNRNQAGAVTAPVILVFSALGGSMIPISQLPQGLREISRFTPNYWFIQGTAAIQKGLFPLAPTLVLLIAGLVLTTASLPLLVRRVSP